MILIKTVRINGFRGLQNIEVELDKTTILTGMNNTGKTSFLKALQLALGSRNFLSQDDFFVSENNSTDKIIVDLKIIPVDSDSNRTDNFDNDWEILFTEKRITNELSDKSIVPLRTVITSDRIQNDFKIQQFILSQWPIFLNEEDKIYWHQSENGKETNFRFDEIPFFFMDAQRDILEDIKMKSSFLGKMISKIEYEEKDIKEIEIKINELNEKAVSSSTILSNIKDTLKDLDTTMDTSSEGVEITPFTKKIRDLSKGLSIYYTDKKDSFSMEYHGMGTRSWSSLLTLKSFISLRNQNAEKEQTAFFPILAIEEPEAHLHPNAQKKLYNQINEVNGQKIISTHSPFIVASADLKEIRNFYKDDDLVTCGQIPITDLVGDYERKIRRQVINTRGEIFFSKAVVLLEGETEEQALPIFAEHYFKKLPFEMGINFIGVASFGNYLPFIKVLDALNIPWFILSDAEESTIESVLNQVSNINNNNFLKERVVFLDKGNNFENQLISDGYIEEIREAMKELKLQNCTNNFHKKEKEKKIAQYSEQKLLDTLKNSKTQIAPLVAEKIIGSGKALPPQIIDLFKKIEKVFNKNEAT